MTRGHVVVVGGGLAGLATAAELSRDWRVTVVEQGDAIGQEASAHNAGMVRRLGEEPWERALAIRSHERLVALDERDTPPSRVVGAVLGVGLDATWLNDAVAHCRARGIAVEQLDRPHTVAPALVGAPWLSAWYEPEARVADGHTLIAHFAKQLRAQGGSIRTGERTRELAVQGGRVTAVQTEAGRLDADHVVLAAGAWSRVLGHTAGVDRPLIPLRRTLLHTGPHALSTPSHPWCWIDDVGAYIRPEGGGWLGSGCDEQIDPPALGPGSKGPVDALNRALWVDKLGRWFPAVADATVIGGWTGLRTFAPDRRPVLGPDPDVEGLHWAAGLGGFGLTCCLAVGECVAAWISGRSVDFIRPRPVSPGRSMLSRWPIRPLGDVNRGELVKVTREVLPRSG